MTRLASPTSYLIFRGFLGIYLAGSCLLRLDRGDPWWLTLTLVALSIGAMGFGWGIQKPWLSVVLACGSAFLWGQDLSVATSSSLAVSAVMLGTAFVPKVSFKTNISEWTFPPWIFYFGWFLLALGYGLSGSTLGLIFAPLCFFRKTRWFVWLIYLVSQLANLVSLSLGDSHAASTIGMIVLHLLTFDPRWIPPKKSQQKPVIFFDGVCNLCNGFVSWLVGEDFDSNLRFASLQGDTAKTHLAAGSQTLDTVLFWADGQVYQRSEAILRIGIHLGGVWWFLWIFKIIPPVLRDVVYRWIASRRYRFFGKSPTCRIPSPAEKTRFLA